MKKLIDNFLDDNNRKWHIFILSILFIFTATQAMKLNAWLGVSLLLAGLFLFRMYLEYDVDKNGKDELNNLLNELIPSAWAYSIRGNIITIIREDKASFRIAKNVIPKNNDIDILWKESFNKSNMLVDMFNSNKINNVSIGGFIGNVLFNTKNKVNEFTGTLEELIGYIDTL